MQEKDRYSWYNHFTEEIYDSKDDVVFVGAITVLNQQNRRIWELIEENQQLKQQLHDLPKKIVEEIKDKIPEIGGMKCEIIIDDSLTLNTLLDIILKKYGGEDE